MTEKRWILKEQGDELTVANLANVLGVDAALANLLVQRGITSFDEAKSFFRPQIGHLHDPYLMKDMDKAVDRLVKAVDEREKILVYGDYDVDGTTAVATIYAFLKAQNVQVSYFIPDRYKDGYGVAIRGIDHAKECGATLIIALDCGIKAVEKVKYAKGLGIDFIICDHHLPGNEIPDAVAVLDAQRPDCTYPYRDLSGCGVGYKLLQAYCIRRKVSCKVLESLLDMVAVSIASDIVPITGENRILAHYGLEHLNRSPRRGLHAIIKRSGLHEDAAHAIGIDDIVFRIGPRINAAGRMESGKTAVDLLTAETDEIANEVGDIINDRNNDRKDVDHRHTEEAKQIVEQDPQLQRKHTTVLYNPDWHKGVVGIVASRLVEKFYRPTIVLTQNKENNLVTGSARSIPGFDLYRAVEQCEDLLISYGGHLYAAGLTLTAENVEPFIERFEQVAASMLTPEMLIPQIEIDEEITFAQITPKFNRILKQFKPFGPGNLSPVFCTRRVYCNGNLRVVGIDKAHLKLDLVQENSPGTFTAIAFNFAEFYTYIKDGNPIDVCYNLAENVYQGRTNLQLKIKDIKRSQQ